MSTFTIISNNNNAPTSSIVWSDTETTENRVGVFNSVEIDVTSIIDIEGSTIYSLWQINTGSGFVDNIFLAGSPQIFSITAGVTQFRLKNTDEFGMIGYSNILQYSYNPPVYDNHYLFLKSNFLSSEEEAISESCNFNIINQNMSFNIANIDGHQLGLNYVGSQPSILKILSYTTTATETKFNGTVSIPHVLPILTTLLNIPITFPYNISLSSFNIAILPIKVFSSEFSILDPKYGEYTNIICPVFLVMNMTTVINTIEYEVIDINGISGGVKTSNVISRYNPLTLAPPPLPQNPIYPLLGYNVCFPFIESELNCALEKQFTIIYINTNGQLQNAVGPGFRGVCVGEETGPILVHQIINGSSAVTIC